LARIEVGGFSASIPISVAARRRSSKAIDPPGGILLSLRIAFLFFSTKIVIAFKAPALPRVAEELASPELLPLSWCTAFRVSGCCIVTGVAGLADVMVALMCDITLSKSTF
jgi:hypothetical protein